MTGDANPLGVIPAAVTHVRLPRDAAALFSRRAARLRELAVGHVSADWLEALAQLCDAQSRAVALASPLPPARELESRQPLHFARWRREPVWRERLDLILAVMQQAALPPPARAAVAALATSRDDAREAWADALLAGGEHDLAPAAAPILAAALQAHWTALAAQLSAATLARSDDSCPACGSAPLSGLVLGDDKVRYLCCSLCASQWHRARVQCVICSSGAAVSYYAIEGGAAGVKAETCASCKAYLKLFYQEQAPAAEPLADDAATLALDILLGDAGYARCGVNLLVSP